MRLTHVDSFVFDDKRFFLWDRRVLIHLRVEMYFHRDGCNPRLAQGLVKRFRLLNQVFHSRVQGRVTRVSSFHRDFLLVLHVAFSYFGSIQSRIIPTFRLSVSLAPDLYCPWSVFRGAIVRQGPCYPSSHYRCGSSCWPFRFTRGSLSLIPPLRLA